MQGNYRFGEFLVDVARARLLRRGVALHLEPKAFDVLVHLIRSRDRVVGKDELLEVVWQGSFVTDNALTQAVSRLRRTLNDDPHHPQSIETAHTLGYRFIAEVVEVDSAPDVMIGSPRPAISGSRSRQFRLTVLAAGILLLGVMMFGVWKIAEPPSRAPARLARSAGWRPMIAVLPFENLGPSEDDYFAAGMTEEITTLLAAVEAIGVISRKSADLYADTDKAIPQIGEELGADFILEGSVRRDRSFGDQHRVRISPQLIRVDDDSHVWAFSYDRVLDDVFAVQTEIARAVLRRLDIVDLDTEKVAVEARPTQNFDAYNSYLRGLNRIAPPFPSESEWHIAVDMFSRAVDLDPEFVLGHSFLSISHSALHWLYAPAEEHVREAKKAADRALELDPDLSQGHLALGIYFFWCRRDYELALKELEVAERGLPNDDFIAATIGLIQRRQGKFEQARGQLERAFELNPRSARYAFFVGWSYGIERHYEEADRWYDLSISLAPDQITAYHDKARNYWLWKGTTEESRKVLAAMPVQGAVNSTDWYFQELYERDYSAVLDRMTTARRDFLRDWPRDLLEAWAFDLAGEAEAAAASYQRAHFVLMERLKKRPESWKGHSYMGLTLAALGRKEQAVREGKRAIELLPIAQDAFSGPSRILDLALIHTRTGQFDEALDRLEFLLSIPAGQTISVPLLELDPRWDALRSHPRYLSLVQGPPPNGE